jgi:Kef-type K+ transport system membrane component KefB/mannitol/fructose-specific phosphotransferase system IIA component (Ntr-type)
MERLTSYEITVMFVALGTLLATARFLGEVAKRYHQPAVLGEILAGVLLGPTVLGALAPDWSSWLFPMAGHNALVLDGFATLAIALFLLVAGMEVDLSTMWRQGKIAAAVGVAGVVAPFVVGFGAAWFAPWSMGWEGIVDVRIFALFFASALSISALPVIARTLLDLNLYRSDFGMIIIAAAVSNDLVGWIAFALILGLMGHENTHGFGLGATIAMTLGFTGLVLTLGRWLFHRVLPWVKAHTSWPGGVLGFAMVLALFGAACTEAIGIHAIFGAFIVGVAIGDSAHLRSQTRAVIEQFVSFIFAPLFFASIGLNVNFVTFFDWRLVLVVFLIASVGKVIGCGLGARYGGLPPREAWALGVAMNARGAMEIILGLLALQYGVIHERLFVALVIMALVTSALSGPVMTWILGQKPTRRLSDYVSARAFLNPLQAFDRPEAIHVLAQCASAVSGLDAERIAAAVIEREELMSTGLNHGLAAPHARLEGLRSPVVVTGLSHAGIDFDADDGLPAQMIFLLLTPPHDDSIQLDLLTDITERFQDAETRARALLVGSYTEFLALMKEDVG